MTQPQVELVMFDFDGTLAHRPGMWTKCLADVLDEHVPDHGATIDDLRPFLRDGFPWHTPELEHTNVSEADDWWRLLHPTFDRAFAAVGVDPDIRPTLMEAVRSHYCDPQRFELYDDTVGALTFLRERGIRAVILSNHVPELPHIVGALGLSDLVDDVLTSAVIGYEKPHPGAFRCALGPMRADRACMIGDNPVADIAGADRAGLRALLVRHPDSEHDGLLAAVEAL